MGLFSEDGALAKEVGGLALWIWIVIAVAAVVVLIVGIVIAVCVKKSKKKNAQTATAESEQQAVTSAPAEEEKKAVAEDTVVVPVKEEPVKEEKPVQKTATKTTAKTAKTTATTAKTAQKDESEAPKVYHVSKRASDKKWQVKAEGADKALRLFFTQADAIEYAKKVAGNQSGRIVVHKEGGGFRKLNY